MKSTEFFLESPLLLLLGALCALAVFAAWRLLRSAAHRRGVERAALFLRVAELLLLAVIAAGPQLITYARDTSMVVLVDRSQSMSAAREAVDALASEIAQKAQPGSVLATVDFAAQVDGVLNAEATDIAAALEQAGKRLEGRAGARVALISDGAQTEGDALEAAKRLGEAGVRLDVMHVDTAPTGPEAEITGFTLPGDAAQGQRLSATVSVSANAAMEMTLRVYDDETLALEQPISVLAGPNTFACSLTASGVGEHTIRAEIAGGGDGIAENNVQFVGMDVRQSARILLVDGDGTQSAKLASLLREGGSTVDVAKAAALPDSVSALCEYGLIVLMNVNAAELPEGSDERLSAYVKEYGRSLLTTGGEQTYIYGNMKDTALEALLPVSMSVEEKESADPVALMLVIDVTDSMTRASSGVPIEMARRGAIKCVDALNANDYAGVITFSDEAQVLVDMTPMSRKGEVIEAINGITTADPDRITKFSGALQTACDTLAAFDKLERKHIIFITDGSPADGKDGFDAIARQMRQSGITLSTIAVGRLMNVVKLLEGLSAISGGRCYFVEGASDLPDIMSTDTVLSQVQYTIKDPVLPQMGTPVFPMDESALTQLYGYIRTSAKGGAAVALHTPEGRPLYAQWDAGAGKAASFMSDMKGDWSRLWFGGEAGKAMIQGMIKQLVPHAAMQVQTERTLAPSYPQEYAMVSRADGELLMMELAGAAGGALAHSADELLAIDMGATPTAHDVALPLSILVAALLLADIVARRTKLGHLSAWLAARRRR